MILALYVIGSTAGLILLTIRLSAAQEELDRVRGEYDDRNQTVREESSAYAHGVAMSLACLLAGLAAAAWYAPPRPSARPAGNSRAAGREGTPAGGPDGRADR